MKQKPYHLILFLAVALSASPSYGQSSSGPIVKKPRTVEDYKPGTLKEMVADAKPDGLVPFRVKVTYTASVRPISASSSEVLRDWAMCCAGNPDHYKGYIKEIRFVENGAEYWLATEEGLATDLQKDAKAGDFVDLFLIRPSPPETGGKRRSVLLVERFQKPETNSNQINASLDWIRSNLSSYTGKDLRVQIPGPCQLSIADSSNRAGVSVAAVWLPLIDLDPSKVSVEPQDGSNVWTLWLHTTSAKNSIRFMLYQGGPAEGGETSKYSLSIPSKKKAETMAEAFRAAIKLCAPKSPPLD
jgi:hypothetical protein